MMAHALEHPRQEVCGLVVARGSKCRVIRASNLAENPERDFDLDPRAWLEVATDEDVLGIYHSHPNGPAIPSAADLASCEATGLRWYIVSPGSGGYTSFEPSGYEAPYEGRPYVYGVHDCYAIVRDWFKREHGIALDPIDSENYWWERGESLFLDNFEKQGFIQVLGEVPRKSDLSLIQISGPCPNHIVVHTGRGTILHHIANRLSCEESWDGMYSRYATHLIRHKDLL